MSCKKCVALKELVVGLQSLLVAYRLGTLESMGDSALCKIEKAREKLRLLEEKEDRP